MQQSSLKLAEYSPGSEVYLLVKSTHSKRDEIIMLEHRSIEDTHLLDTYFHIYSLDAE